MGVAWRHAFTRSRDLRQHRIGIRGTRRRAGSQFQTSVRAALSRTPPNPLIGKGLQRWDANRKLQTFRVGPFGCCSRTSFETHPVGASNSLTPRRLRRCRSGHVQRLTTGVVGIQKQTDSQVSLLARVRGSLRRSNTCRHWARLESNQLSLGYEPSGTPFPYTPSFSLYSSNAACFFPRKQAGADCDSHETECQRQCRRNITPQNPSVFRYFNQSSGICPF